MKKTTKKDPFNQVITSLGGSLTIQVGDISKGDAFAPLGQYDVEKDVITLSKTTHKTGRHIILIHELLHAMEVRLKAAGYIKRLNNHTFITAASAGLLHVLVELGLYTGVSMKELQDFYEQVGAAEAMGTGKVKKLRKSTKKKTKRAA